MRASRPSIAELYATHRRPMVGLLVSLGGNPSDAEELVQGAFVKALLHWRKIGRYDDPAAWVRLVAVRDLMTQLRKENRRRDVDQTPDATQGTTEQVEDRLAVEQAVNRLSLDHRQVIVLHYAADLPLAEIAQILRIPLGTVQSRLGRARDHLMSLLNVEENENA